MPALTVPHPPQYPCREDPRASQRLWLKFPKPWPLSPEFPTHPGYKPSQDTRELVEAET